MTLEQQVTINNDIMALIKSRYIDFFPPGYNTPDSRYYHRLEEDIARAEQYEGLESSRVQSS